MPPAPVRQTRKFTSNWSDKLRVKQPGEAFGSLGKPWEALRTWEALRNRGKPLFANLYEAF